MLIFILRKARIAKSPVFRLHLADISGAMHRCAMIASLMMYARPELQTAHASLWDCLRSSLDRRGIASPPTLAQNAPEMDVWQDPTLVFSQTCGMPYRTRLHDTVQLVCTPDYGLEGCKGGYYNSAIVVRADDARLSLPDYESAILAYNSGDSQSGFAAIYHHTRAEGFWFNDRVQSGGHLNSARMVAEGKADIAALDAQTWRLIRRYEPMAEHLRVLEFTEPTPALPYITGPQHNPDVVFDAVTEALFNLPSEDAAALDLRGVVRIPHADYAAVPTPPAAALT